MKKVFLGGTCNGSNWRLDVMDNLKIDYFNPVVENWTPECQEEELFQRENCDYVLYFITPKMTGVYSIAEVVEDSIKRPEKTIFCWRSIDLDCESFTPAQEKSLDAVGRMVERNGGIYFKRLYDVINYLNAEK